MCVMFEVLVLVVVAVAGVQFRVECSSGMLELLCLSERRREARKDSNEFLLRVVVVVIAVG